MITQIKQEAANSGWNGWVFSPCKLAIICEYMQQRQGSNKSSNEVAHENEQDCA